VAFEALGRASGCYNNPGEAPGFEGEITYLGCKKFSSGWGTLNAYFRADGSLFGGQGTVTEVLNFKTNPDDYQKYSEMTYLDRVGARQTAFLNSDFYWQIDPTEGAVCEEQAPGPQFPDWQPDTPIGPTYEYYDKETGCTWQIKPYDVYLNSAGEPVFHWKATSNDPVNCGGPHEWWGNGQEPNIPAFEDPRGPDARPTPPTLPPGPGDDLKDRLDKIEEQLEQLKECACPEEEPIQGQFRTISFRSDETSPFGKSRLRKRLRYRGSEGVELSALVDHWRDFSWQSGPVRVDHVGASWGSPQVWAATEDEGKRVIRHAGREAGIDPDQVGRWSARSSNSPRCGVSDTMRVDTTGGYYWITARDGSDQRPIVAK